MEEWKDYIYHYEISSFGRIRNKFTGKILKQSITPKGYYHVTISLGARKEKTTIRIHRAVAILFVPNPDNLPQINHIDGNKLNNNVNNLEWCNNSYNKQHAYNLGITKPLYGEGNHSSKLKSADVEFIRKNYIPYDKNFGCRGLSRRFNIHHKVIEDIIHNRAWKYI